MRDNQGILPTADFLWEKSKFGSLGWATIAVPSRNPSGDKLLGLGCDTAGFRIKNVSSGVIAMRDVFNRTDTPALIDFGDTRPSVFAFDWAGQSSNKFWTVILDKVLLFTGSTYVDKTPTGGVLTAPGRGSYRQVQQKCASDPINENVFVFSSASAGWKYTLNQAPTPADWTSIAWCPVPTHPTSGVDSPDLLGIKFGQIAWDETSARVGTVGQERYSRVTLTSHGRGIYQSTDGLVTGAKISPVSPHALDGTSATIWRGGVLYAIAGALESWNNNSINNLWRWDGGTAWTQLTATEPQMWFGIVADPRSATAFILSHTSANYSYCSDLAVPSAYKHFIGVSALVSSLGQMKTQNRPMVTQTYRLGGGGSAPGPMAICGPYLYLLLGYGPIRTPIAAFPVAGANYSNPNYSVLWPDWEEDAGGYEAVIGMSTCFLGDVLYVGAQDLGFAVFQDEVDGHDAGYREFPGKILTNGIGISRGSDPMFGVMGSYKATVTIGYTNDGGRSVKKMPNGPLVTNLGPVGPGGAIVAGPNKAAGVALAFPTYAGFPQYTDDLGETGWKNLVFKRENASIIDLSIANNGFHGTPYYNNHWNAAHDPFNPGVYYCVNIGGGTNWENDNADHGGVYRMNWAATPGVFNRVLDGSPAASNGNRGLYNMYMDFSGDGHLLIMDNPMLGSNPVGNNNLKDVNLTDNTLRIITSVTNIYGFAFGAPLDVGGPLALWVFGWHNGMLGIWLSFDRFLTDPWGRGGVPRRFEHRSVQGGGMQSLSAHQTKFGILAGAVGEGAQRGRLQL